MTASLAAAAATTLAASLSPDWTTLIALRALTGLALSGVPAVAMAYLAEEMDRSAIGLAMGLYIAGNTLGGMAGRLGGAAIADVVRMARGVRRGRRSFRSPARVCSLSRCRRSGRPRQDRPTALLPAIRRISAIRA